jgi:hypothetical protein
MSALATMVACHEPLPAFMVFLDAETGKKLKLLACAECDLGPLGWSEEGGTEFWLTCSRVGYRA